MRNDERLRTIYEVMAPYIVRSERNWRDYTAMLEDSLEHRQELVGGDIECIPLPCETVLCCNATGKLAGLPKNRQYGPDTIWGTFFLYGDTSEGRGVSLTEEQIAYFRDYFTEPRPLRCSQQKIRRNFCG